MVPRQPGELGAIRVEPRVGIKITPGHEDCLFPTGEINTDQAIHRFLSRRVNVSSTRVRLEDTFTLCKPVIFAHADQTATLGVNNGVGIT